MPFNVNISVEFFKIVYQDWELQVLICGFHQFGKFGTVCLFTSLWLWSSNSPVIMTVAGAALSAVAPGTPLSALHVLAHLTITASL